MADKRTEPETADERRHKRAAPTIDLTATELQSTPSEPAAAPAPQPEAPPAEAAAQPSSAPPPPPPPPEQPAPPAREEPSAEVAPPPRAARPRTYLIALAAGFVGAAIMGGALAGLWYYGMLHLPSNDTQIAALQAEIQVLKNRPPPTDAKAIDALQARVRQLAGEIAKLPPGDKSVAERLAAADNALKALGIALTALNHRNDGIAADAKQARERADAAEKAVKELQDRVQHASKEASAAVAPAELDALQKRVGALAQSVKDAQAAIAKNTTTDKAARLAVSAAVLRDSVERGAPYADELAQAKTLGADAKTLAPLAPFAAKGVPSNTALAHELSALIPALRKAAGEQAPPGGFLDRLQANAGKLVRVAPIAAPQGDAPADVLARIAVEAAKADIDGALADLAKLPPLARAPAQGWIAKATARQQALVAARNVAAAASRALGKS